jgi:hypothetical protein
MRPHTLIPDRACRRVRERAQASRTELLAQLLQWSRLSRAVGNPGFFEKEDRTPSEDEVGAFIRQYDHRYNRSTHPYPSVAEQCTVMLKSPSRLKATYPSSRQTMQL